MKDGTHTTIDLHKQYKHEYVTPKQPVIVKPGPAKYLIAEFRGEAGGEAFQTAMGALYAAAYTIKFACKAAGKDFKVSAPEAQVWVDDKYRCFQDSPRNEWNWHLLIRVPTFVTARDLAKAVAAKGDEAPAMAGLRIETLKEGSSVQMLHGGPYADEPASIKAMLDFAAAQGLEPHGRHHEIYLSDPRRVPEVRLRTILRIPVHAKSAVASNSHAESAGARAH
jgi:hypothetical protein